MTDKFQDQYEMHVLPSSRKLRRIPRSYQKFNMWDVDIDDSMLYSHNSIPIEEVDCVEILMPVDRLQELEDIIAWYKSKEKYIKGYEDVIGMLKADERVRIENPPVQKAYRKYLTLLELCR